MKVFHTLIDSVQKTHITEGQHKGWILFTLNFTISEEGVDTRKYSTSFITSQIGCLFHKLYPWLPDLIHLIRLDKMGRNPNKKIVYNKDDIILKLDKIVDKHFRDKPNLNEQKIICPMCNWPIYIKKEDI